MFFGSIIQNALPFIVYSQCPGGFLRVSNGMGSYKFGHKENLIYSYTLTNVLHSVGCMFSFINQFSSFCSLPKLLPWYFRWNKNGNCSTIAECELLKLCRHEWLALVVESPKTEWGFCLVKLLFYISWDFIVSLHNWSFTTMPMQLMSCECWGSSMSLENILQHPSTVQKRAE